MFQQLSASYSNFISLRNTCIFQITIRPSRPKNENDNNHECYFNHSYHTKKPHWLDHFLPFSLAALQSYFDEDYSKLLLSLLVNCLLAHSTCLNLTEMTICNHHWYSIAYANSFLETWRHGTTYRRLISIYYIYIFPIPYRSFTINPVNPMQAFYLYQMISSHAHSLDLPFIALLGKQMEIVIKSTCSENLVGEEEETGERKGRAMNCLSLSFLFILIAYLLYAGCSRFSCNLQHMHIAISIYS